MLQVVGPVEVLALVAVGSLQGHAVLQTPLHREDARRVGVTHHGARLGVDAVIVQRYLEVGVVVDLKGEQRRRFSRLQLNDWHVYFSQCGF